MAVDRRSFLQSLGSAALAAAFPESIAKALSIRPNHQNRSIADVEHIVILMQENRSFDHYFGTLDGVRGFADPEPFLCRPAIRSGTNPIAVAVTFCPFTRLLQI